MFHFARSRLPVWNGLLNLILQPIQTDECVIYSMINDKKMQTLRVVTNHAKVFNSDLAIKNYK